jgi:hypothetical protein
MRKSVLAIGLILLVACGVLLALYEIPQNTEKTYNATADFANTGGYPRSYNGQTYWITYGGSFHAKAGDEILITFDPTRDNGGNWAIVFIEWQDPNYQNIPAYLTIDTFGNVSCAVSVGTGYVIQSYPTYSEVRGGVLPCYGLNDNGYDVRLGVVENSITDSSTNTLNIQSAGAYSITVDVTSKIQNPTYDILAFAFLIAGLVVTIVGLVSKSKGQKLRQGDNLNA